MLGGNLFGYNTGISFVTFIGQNLIVHAVTQRVCLKFGDKSQEIFP